MEMKQFTPPVIKKDEEVEKPPPPQEELKEAKIDVVNVEGVKDEGLAAPTDIDNGKQIVEEKIDETHTASLAEFELAKEAQAYATLELKELKEISKELHTLITEVEKRVK